MRIRYSTCRSSATSSLWRWVLVLVKTDFSRLRAVSHGISSSRATICRGAPRAMTQASFVSGGVRWNVPLLYEGRHVEEDIDEAAVERRSSGCAPRWLRTLRWAPFTLVSIARSYCLRRVFERIRVRAAGHRCLGGTLTGLFK
jgi:hypothetical protein